MFGDLFFGISLPAIKHTSRAFTFALVGVLEHESDYHVGRPADLSELEMHVAQALGLDECHVHASPVLAQSYNEYEQGMCYERFALIHDAHLIASMSGEEACLALPEHNFNIGNSLSAERRVRSKSSTPVAIYITLSFGHKQGIDAQEFFAKQELISEKAKAFDTFHLEYAIDGQLRRAELSIIDAGLPGSIYTRLEYYLETLEAIEAMEMAEKKAGCVANLSFNMEPVDLDLLSGYCNVSIHSTNGKLLERYNTRPVQNVGRLMQNLDMAQQYKLQNRSILFPEQLSAALVH